MFYKALAVLASSTFPVIFLAVYAIGQTPPADPPTCELRLRVVERSYSRLIQSSFANEVQITGDYDKLINSLTERVKELEKKLEERDGKKPELPSEKGTN